MSTVALSMITNNAQATLKVLEKYGKHFDKVFITVADKNKKQFKVLEKLHDGDKDKTYYNLSYFKWEDNFGKAREFNRQQIDTDYFFWMDDDDELLNPEAIPQLVQDMKKEGLDAIYMKYDYIKNDIGEGIGDHWRERLIRTKSNLKWAQSRVHETLVAPNAVTARTTDMSVLHKKTKEDEAKSMERNIKLLKLDFEETKDPRTAMYLGDNLMAKQEYDVALGYFTHILQHGGWDEDKYRSWLKVAEIFYLTGRPAEGLSACHAASELQPDWPDAYFMMASIYNDLKRPKNVYEWVKVGLTKPVPDTMSVHDPTLYEYRAIFMASLAALELGKINEAYKLFQIVRQRSPDYKLAKEMEPLFEEAYYDTQAIDRLKWLLMYLKDNGGDPQKYLMALPSRLLIDPRLNFLRSKLIEPKVWPKKSVVFYCGRGTEPWGPDTLKNGMGGSEEAIVYLSREMAKLGWDVTVYCDREEAMEDGDVHYKPWQLLNPNDTFDVFIAWRAPSFTKGVKARIKGVDLHDTPMGHQTVTDDDVENTDLYFFKSNYQTEYAPNIPKEKIVVVGNGIKRSQFDEETK